MLNKSNFEEVSIVNSRKRINKRGDKYYILISLILGLIVLSLSLYFIFQEYFNEEMIDMESCRQSILLRATLPEAKVAKINWESFKDDFPLKCKTEVVDITKEDIIQDNAGVIIADTIVQCWNLYGNGDLNAFPSGWVGKKSVCVPCARIRLTNEAKKYMEENRSAKINIFDTMNTKLFRGTTYFNYLRDIGDAFPPLSFASAGNYWYGSNFTLADVGYSVSLKNRNTGAIETPEHFWLFPTEYWIAKITLPRYFNPDQGDMLINYGVVTRTNPPSGGVGEYIPYLFYFQIDQPNDPFEEVKRDIFYDSTKLIPGTNDLALCEFWEGIPA